MDEITFEMTRFLWIYSGSGNANFYYFQVWCDSLMKQQPSKWTMISWNAIVFYAQTLILAASASFTLIERYSSQTSLPHAVCDWLLLARSVWRQLGGWKLLWMLPNDSQRSSERQDFVWTHIYVQLDMILASLPPRWDCFSSYEREFSFKLPSSESAWRFLFSQ